jgi:hypothetical protein
MLSIRISVAYHTQSQYFHCFSCLVVSNIFFSNWKKVNEKRTFINVQFAKAKSRFWKKMCKHVCDHNAVNLTFL